MPSLKGRQQRQERKSSGRAMSNTSPRRRQSIFWTCVMRPYGIGLVRAISSPSSSVGGSSTVVPTSSGSWTVDASFSKEMKRERLNPIVPFSTIVMPGSDRASSLSHESKMGVCQTKHVTLRPQGVRTQLAPESRCHQKSLLITVFLAVLWECRNFGLNDSIAWCKKGKEKCKCLKIKHLHFILVPCGLSVFEPIYGRLG